MAHTVADEVGDGDEFEVVFAAKDGEIGEARHGAIVIHDFANDAAVGETGEAGEVDRSFSLTGANKHAALTGAEREDVAGAGEIVGARVGLHAELDGV